MFWGLLIIEFQTLKEQRIFLSFDFIFNWFKKRCFSHFKIFYKGKRYFFLIFDFSIATFFLIKLIRFGRAGTKRGPLFLRFLFMHYNDFFLYFYVIICWVIFRIHIFGYFLEESLCFKAFLIWFTRNRFFIITFYPWCCFSFGWAFSGFGFLDPKRTTIFVEFHELENSLLNEFNVLGAAKDCDEALLEVWVK